MNENLDIIGVIISGIISIYIVIRSSQLYFGNTEIRVFITEYYSNMGLQISNISRLNITERLKYGVPISVMWLYTYYFGFLFGTIDYVRKVDITENEKEFIKYVELRVRNREVISFREFDSFEY